MNKSGNSILKIYASTTDKIGFDLLYEHVVLKAQERGIAGVTAYRGIMGYGASNKIETARFWELTEKLPVVIEMIDSTEVLEDFYQFIETDLHKAGKGCLITMQPVEIKLKKTGDSKNNRAQKN